MPNEEGIPIIGMTLEKRKERLESKAKAQDKAIDAEIEYRKANWKIGEPGFIIADYNKGIAEIEDAIKALNKKIVEELLEYEAHKRKKRYEEWPQWWNLWIGGYLAAVIVDFVKGLGRVVDMILKNLNNPELMLEKAYEAINEMAKKIPSIPL